MRDFRNQQLAVCAVERKTLHMARIEDDHERQVR